MPLAHLIFNTPLGSDISMLPMGHKAWGNDSDELAREGFEINPQMAHSPQTKVGLTQEPLKEVFLNPSSPH